MKLIFWPSRWNLQVPHFHTYFGSVKKGRRKSLKVRWYLVYVFPIVGGKSDHDVDVPARLAGMADAPARGTTISVASYVRGTGLALGVVRLH
jgi:hypothetical protein